MADTILRYESAQELEIVEANADSVFFTVQDRDDGSRNLWVANSDEVTQIETPSGELGDAGIVVHAASDRVFMSIYDVAHGSRLSTIDLTSTPLIAKSVVDIWTGTRSSRVIGGATFQNQLLVSVETEDDTGERVRELLMVRPGETEFSKVGPDNFYATQIEVDGDRVFMVATGDREVFDVWVADGDLAAPVNVTKTTPDLRPDDGVVVNGHFVFANQRRNRIARTDGTVTSSELDLGSFVVIEIGQSAVYFWLRRATELFESGQWYRTDGTLENTTPVSEADVERDTSVFTVANRRYRLDESKGWLELDSFGRERPLFAGQANLPRHPVQVQDYISFVAKTETHIDEHAWYIYRLNGITGGIEQFVESAIVPAAISAVEQTLFFTGFDQFHGSELWQVPLPFDGDVDNAGRVDVDDVDTLCNAIRDENQSVQFDINLDGIVDFQDFDDMIHDVHQTTYGDASLDGVFDSSDLTLVFFEGRFESELSLSDRPSAWRAGDWNCNGEFDISDFVLAFRDGGYVRDGIAAQPVRAGIDNQFAASIDGSGRHLDPRDGQNSAFVP